MKKVLAATVAVMLCLTGFAFYGTVPVQTFTPTAQATIAASSAVSTTSALGSTAASAPMATTAIVANIGSNPAYVLFGASNVVATTVNGFAVPPNTVSLPLSIKGSTHAAAISTAGATSVSISTGY